MKNGASSGTLGITVEHLLLAPKWILEIALILANISLMGIHAPEAVRAAVRPLYKSDEKFRPIALMEVTHKLVMSEMADRVSTLIGTHGLVESCNKIFHCDISKLTRRKLLPTHR